MKKKTIPTSVRLDNDLLKEVAQRCDKLGCTRNDFIKNSVEFTIYNSSNFDFGDEDKEEETEEPKPIITEIIEPKKSSMVMHGKILDDDGNVIGTF